jgi:hypothetical protein
MYSRNLRHLAGALILVAGLAGCEAGLAGPGEEAFDAEATTADLATVDGAYETEAYKALEALGEQFSVPGVGLASASAQLLRADRPESDGSLGDRAIEISREIALSLQSSAPLIPSQFLGITMVWNGEEYVVDAEATGAPSNGIRFILYAVNPITDRIAEELTPIGYADVLDVGGDNSAALRLVVVSGDVTYVDYTVSATGVFNAPSIVIEGYLSDGENRVDFRLSHTLAFTIASANITIDYEIEIADRDFSIAISVVVSEANEVNETSLDITVMHGRNSVTAIGMTENGVGSVEVSGNGEVFATINLNGDEVEVVSATGEPLTERQIHALRSLMEMLDKAFKAHENLFRPVSWLFEIG